MMSLNQLIICFISLSTIVISINLSSITLKIKKLKHSNISYFIKIINPYYSGEFVIENCLFSDHTGDIIFDRDQNNPNTNFYWGESELTDGINNCHDYCEKPLKIHFNKFSNLQQHGNIKYLEYLNDKMFKDIREQNRKMHKAKIETTLVLLSSCNWRINLLRKIKSHLIKEGNCFNNSKHSRMELMSHDDLISISSFKYLFAVENSNCYGYVSEKIHKALLVGVVPLVYNISNYPPIFNSIKPYVIDLANEWSDQVSPPDENVLQQFYKNWKSDLESICDLINKGVMRNETQTKECVKSCERKFDCGFGFGLNEYDEYYKYPKLIL